MLNCFPDLFYLCSIPFGPLRITCPTSAGSLDKKKEKQYEGTYFKWIWLPRESLSAHMCVEWTADSIFHLIHIFGSYFSCIIGAIGTRMIDPKRIAFVFFSINFIISFTYSQRFVDWILCARLFSLLFLVLFQVFAEVQSRHSHSNRQQTTTKKIEEEIEKKKTKSDLKMGREKKNITFWFDVNRVSRVPKIGRRW